MDQYQTWLASIIVLDSFTHERNNYLHYRAFETEEDAVKCAEEWFNNYIRAVYEPEYGPFIHARIHEDGLAVGRAENNWYYGNLFTIAVELVDKEPYEQHPFGIRYRNRGVNFCADPPHNSIDFITQPGKVTADLSYIRSQAKVESGYAAVVLSHHSLKVSDSVGNKTVRYINYTKSMAKAEAACLDFCHHAVQAVSLVFGNLAQIETKSKRQPYYYSTDGSLYGPKENGFFVGGYDVLPIRVDKLTLNDGRVFYDPSLGLLYDLIPDVSSTFFLPNTLH